MTKPRVLLLKKLPDEAMRIIGAHCEIKAYDEKRIETREGLLELLSDVDGLLQTDVRIDAELLASAPRLRVASNQSVGYNNFDLAAMRERGVAGTHTPYVLDDTVADLVFALLLSAARRVPELDRLVKRGDWGRDGAQAEDHFGIDVHHATIGIIGMGRIGEAIAKRAALGFDMQVLYTNRSRKPRAEEAYGAQRRPLEELLRASDFVVLMTPLTAETRGMIGEAELACMKPTSVFVNASRGPLVDESALVRALTENRIRAAGLDVYAEEPVDPNHPLLRLPNAVTLPHIGSATAKTRYDMAIAAANNLVGGLLGDRDVHLVPELQS
ncbi:2-hydroxyacid dehydrogenase [Cohnella nanjingensis]|uniref:D-glycerate dehydrogenase n=1 Tax=Cohnella nanjingensis TaxID=1387779 RepID=A0A7X0RSX4_9BACL|nr:D-glycerate dehydrogenase [Cohnella nanjingensis]MBB6673107.1 D-glycerate dehydrogenase [Cohnella nanjingensis]